MTPGYDVFKNTRRTITKLTYRVIGLAVETRRDVTLGVTSVSVVVCVSCQFSVLARHRTSIFCRGEHRAESSASLLFPISILSDRGGREIHAHVPQPTRKSDAVMSVISRRYRSVFRDKRGGV